MSIEEDKNKARQAWSDGPNESISMGQKKGKSIPCIGPLQREHYTKKGSNKNRAQVLGDSGMGTLNQSSPQRNDLSTMFWIPQVESYKERTWPTRKGSKSSLLQKPQYPLTSRYT